MKPFRESVDGENGPELRDELGPEVQAARVVCVDLR